MNRKWFFLIALLLAVCSCSPKISRNISKEYSPLDYREEVIVFGPEEAVPDNAELLGAAKIGDTGFTIHCDLRVVVGKAITEARKIGGNAIKITEHKRPSMHGSSCHRITFNILKIEGFESYMKVNDIENYIISEAFSDNPLADADYALLHVYREGGSGKLINFDLHLGDTTICRVSNRWKETIKINKDGLNTLWARTEKKAELPINIKLGKEYYIRCSITTGFLIGYPVLELMDYRTGKSEYQSIPENKNKNKNKNKK